MKGRHGIIREILPPVLVLVGAVILMDIGARMLNEPFMLPRPGAVMRVMVDRRAELAASLWTTAEAARLGFSPAPFSGRDWR